MKTTLFVFCLLFGTCIAPPGLPSLEEEWQEWKGVYNKVYSSPGEELKRRAIWEENLDFIEAHNNQMLSTYKMAMNAFGDQHSNEKIFPRITVSSEEHTVHVQDNRPTLQSAPSSFDWRQKGAITPVKNQGSEYTSDAFVVAECVESYHFIHAGKLVGLSEMEVQDCCSEIHHPGRGPTVSDCFGCVHQLGGLCTSGDYTSPTCNATCTPAAQVAGTMFIPSGREDLMVESLLLVPLMVYIDAGIMSFQLYKSGVYYDSSCSKKHLDHTLQVVGYGVIDDTPYWICKNSWGTEWGQDGYILIRRGTNECGIATRAKYPF